MLSVIASVLDHTISWNEYYAIAKKYVEADDKPELYRDEKMLQYTANNIRRIDHVLRTINIESKLYNLLSTITRDMTWVVLTEPWCGDASQVVPVLYTMASCSDKINFRILQSDAHGDILDLYLTNGSRSIPKLVCLDSGNMEESGTWGPRPAALQRIVKENKDDPNLSFKDKVRMVHDWYAADKTISIQEEFIDLIKEWNK